MLWQETFQQRKRHEQQQQLITKILGFLVSVVSTTNPKGGRGLQQSKKRKLLINHRLSSSEDETTVPQTQLPLSSVDLQDKIVELLNNSNYNNLYNSHPVADLGNIDDNIINNNNSPLLQLK